MEDVKKVFEEEYKALCQKHGVQLVSVVQSKQYGAMLQIEPALMISEIEGWTPEEKDSTKIIPN